MSNTIYLYLKTHNVTGLKYLGKTVKDPFKYHGSGLVWKLHLNKHGDDVSTEILFETTDMEEFKRVGLEYSEKWDIVESKEFANLIPEYGTGGDASMTFTEESKLKMSAAANFREGMDPSRIEEINRKISESLMGHTFTEESKLKMSASAKKRGFIKGSGFQKGNEPHNKGKTGHMSDRIWVNNGVSNRRVTVDKIPDGWVIGNTGWEIKETKVCPHCGKQGKGGPMTRWHFDNCKERK